MTIVRHFDLPPMQTLLGELIAQPSISSPQPSWDQSNVGVIDVLTRWFETMGFHCELLCSSEAPRKVNLIATLGDGPPGLILSGHSDTVPFDDAKWLTDPFKVHEESARLYGLGVCDMKGFFPIIVEALRQLEQATLNRSLVVFATADEESSMDGVRHLVKHYQERARALIIGEPTDLNAIRMHKGMMMKKIEVIGRSGHSSNPALGHNAIDVMQEVMLKLNLLRNQWCKTYQVDAFTVPYPTMNFGHICGGDSPNRICARCELSIDVRPVPGMSLEHTKNEIQQALEGIAHAQNVEIKVHDLMEPIPPFEQSEKSDLISQCEAFGKTSTDTVAFATEAPFLQSLSDQTIVMGAGSIDQAHQPNEFLDIRQAYTMSGRLKSLIEHYCDVT